MKKLILDLCGGTGAWSKPYKEAGYEVMNITLPYYNVTCHIRFPDNVYGILAAPPCTMFSLARTRAKKPRDFQEGMETVLGCLGIIWTCRYKHKLAFWCLENPRGFLRQFLGKPALTFKPSEFGDPYSKVTDLWGYFSPPKKLKKPVTVPKGHHRASSWHDADRSAERRSVTPAGFANAFFKANQ